MYHAPWIRDSFDEKRFLSQYVVREEVPRPNRNEKLGQLIVMSAGGTIVRYSDEDTNILFDDSSVEISLEADYLQKLSYVDFDVYARQSTHVFEQLLDDISTYANADIILLDARTGFSNVSGALLNRFSDVLSIHIQDNRQNREGIGFITKHISPKKLQNTIWSYTKVAR